jgi:large subunit ribosomal protein L20
MAKVKHSVATRKRKRKLLKKTKGYFSDRSKQYQQARRALMHALTYAYRDRRNKKRVIRRLWITRINAACRMSGITYSQFIQGL